MLRIPKAWQGNITPREGMSNLMSFTVANYVEKRGCHSVIPGNTHNDCRPLHFGDT
jgi:hypothetical protein